ASSVTSASLRSRGRPSRALGSSGMGYLLGQTAPRRDGILRSGYERPGTPASRACESPRAVRRWQGPVAVRGAGAAPRPDRGGPMSENDERGYDPAEDPDADPRSLNPREGRQAVGGEPQDADPDAEPGNLNPRGGEEASGGA